MLMNQDERMIITDAPISPTGEGGQHAIHGTCGEAVVWYDVHSLVSLFFFSKY